ncbi:unnamed protein product, partial [Staurois parvus]
HPCPPPGRAFHYHPPPWHINHFQSGPSQSAHFHTLLSPDAFTPPSGPDAFTPLPVRTLSSPFRSGRFHPPSGPDAFTPFQSGHFHPLAVRTLST